MSILRPKLALLLRRRPRRRTPYLTRATLQEVTEWQPNWDMVMRLASVDRLQGLMFMQLPDPALEAHVPSGCARRAPGSCHLEEAARNLYPDGRAGPRVAAVRPEDLPVVLLKGMALVATVYEDGGLLLMPVMGMSLSSPATSLEPVTSWPAWAICPLKMRRPGRFRPGHCLRCPQGHPHGHMTWWSWERLVRCPRWRAHCGLAHGPCSEDLLVYPVVTFPESAEAAVTALLGHLCDIAENCPPPHLRNSIGMPFAAGSIATTSRPRHRSPWWPRPGCSKLLSRRPSSTNFRRSTSERCAAWVLGRTVPADEGSLSAEPAVPQALPQGADTWNSGAGSCSQEGASACVLYARRLGAGSQWAAWSLLREWELRRPAA